MKNQKNNAFTLIELMVVVAIIAVVTAILFPVIAGAKFSAKKAASSSNLHQIGLAFSLYKADYNDLPMRELAPIVEAGYVKSKEILMSGCDVIPEGYGTLMRRCTKKPDDGIKTSYESALFANWWWEGLKKIDDNPAIVVDRTCGNRAPKAVDCYDAPLFYWGPIIRTYEDTSAKVGKFWIDTEPGTNNKIWHRARLYTEKPLPQMGVPN